MPSTVLQTIDYTWAQDPADRPYIGLVETTLNSQTSKREQALNEYGNQLWYKIYDYGSSSPTRTYTRTYLTGAPYSTHYIFDRVTQVTVNDGSGAVTLVQNSYDLYSNNAPCAGFGTPLVYRAGLGQYDYTSGSFGNLSASTSGGVTRCFDYDITGMAARGTDGTTASSVTPDPNHNNTVPGTMTTGSLTTDLTWVDFLGLSGAEGPNDEAAAFTYDDRGRVDTATSVHGAMTTYTYATANPYTVKGTLPDGRFTKTTYDGLGRPVKVEKGQGGSTVKSTVETQYTTCACSATGKVWKVSQPYAPGGTKYWTVYTYDAMGRTVQVDHPNNSGSTTYVYSGNTVTVTDAAGKWKKYWRDAYGNLTRVNEPNPGGGTVDTYYTYNFRDQLTQVSMTRNSVTQLRTWNYNRTTGRLASVTHPEMGTVSYTYNSDGTVDTKTDQKAQVTDYSYDQYKRVTQIVAGGATSYTYTYDTDPLNTGQCQPTRWRVPAGPAFDGDLYGRA